MSALKGIAAQQRWVTLVDINDVNFRSKTLPTHHFTGEQQLIGGFRPPHAYCAITTRAIQRGGAVLRRR